jgi:uncharacterized membrane protein YidH (DUF202 family)
MNGPVDAGLQAERTALAWRRTCLALLAGSLVATRILPELFGAWSALLGVAGAVCAGLLLVAIQRRYRMHHSNLHGDGDRRPPTGGGLIGALALFAVSAGVISIGAVAVVILSRDIR